MRVIIRGKLKVCQIFLINFQLHLRVGNQDDVTETKNRLSQ